MSEFLSIVTQNVIWILASILAEYCAISGQIHTYRVLNYNPVTRIVIRDSFLFLSDSVLWILFCSLWLISNSQFRGLIVDLTVVIECGMICLFKKSSWGLVSQSDIHKVWLCDAIIHLCWVLTCELASGELYSIWWWAHWHCSPQGIWAHWFGGLSFSPSSMPWRTLKTD